MAALPDPLTEPRRAKFQAWCKGRGWFDQVNDRWLVSDISPVVGKPTNKVSDLLYGRGAFGASIARQMELTGREKGYPELIPGYFDRDDDAYDKWTNKAIEMIQSLNEEDRKGAVIAIADYMGKLAKLEKSSIKQTKDAA